MYSSVCVNTGKIYGKLLYQLFHRSRQFKVSRKVFFVNGKALRTSGNICVRLFSTIVLCVQHSNDIAVRSKMICMFVCYFGISMAQLRKLFTYEAFRKFDLMHMLH